jgi:peptidoglycan/LPS O-acetylase OafA/YrhL
MMLASLYIPSSNSQNVLEYHQGEYKMVVSQGPAGGTFCLMITSFLLTRALWKMLEHKKLNIPLLYISRYFRIVPLLFFVMVIERFIMQGWVSEFIGAPHFFPNQFSRIFKFYWLPLLQIQNYFADIKETVSISDN